MHSLTRCNIKIEEEFVYILYSADGFMSQVIVYMDKQLSNRFEFVSKAINFIMSEVNETSTKICVGIQRWKRGKNVSLNLCISTKNDHTSSKAKLWIFMCNVGYSEVRWK